MSNPTEPQPAAQRPCEMQTVAVDRVQARNGKPHVQPLASNRLNDQQADEICAAVLVLCQRLTRRCKQ